MKLAALRALFTNLPGTLQRPDDLETRLLCQIAAWLVDHSPMRTQSLRPATAVLLSHALAYELAALCRLPYGLTACLTLPACMRFTAAWVPAVLARQAKVARSLGIVPGDARDQAASNGLTDKLQTLVAQLGLPTRFREVDISHEQLRLVASRFAQRGASLVSGESANERDVFSLLESAW